MQDAKPCAVCGGTSFQSTRILWPALIAEWELSPDEVAYVDRQQGECCTRCGANLRSIVLAEALLSAAGTEALLADFVGSRRAAELKLLEINAAGTLHPHLRRMPGHIFAAYPAVDMQALPYPDGAFDLVIHSDSLEHVPDPIRALRECHRVLKPGAALCCTVPVIVGRRSRSREGLAPSYHGTDGPEGSGRVWTEFGVDAWTYLMAAGFSEVRIISRDYPAALAFLARR